MFLSIGINGRGAVVEEEEGEVRLGRMEGFMAAVRALFLLLPVQSCTAALLLPNPGILKLHSCLECLPSTTGGMQS